MRRNRFLGDKRHYLTALHEPPIPRQAGGRQLVSAVTNRATLCLRLPRAGTAGIPAEKSALKTSKIVYWGWPSLGIDGS